MNQRVLWLAVLAFVFLAPARADFAAGQRAWDAGRVVEALAQWRDAAHTGDGRAMRALGQMHLQGFGVLQDYVEAHKWFNLAASRGDAGAALAAGADVNGQDGRGWTALMHAVNEGRSPLVELLLASNRNGCIALVTQAYPSRFGASGGETIETAKANAYAATNIPPRAYGYNVREFVTCPALVD